MYRSDRVHTKYNLDNIKIKISVCFCNFLIYLLNIFVKHIFKYQRVKFFKIPNQIKRKIFGDSLYNLMNMTLEEFCKIKISPKYKNKKENHNSNSFKIFQKINGNDLFNFTLSNIYQKFFLNKEEIKIRNKEGAIIVINDYMGFDFFLKKEKNDLIYIKKMINVSKNLIYKIREKKLKNEETTKINYIEDLIQPLDVLNNSLNENSLLTSYDSIGSLFDHK